MEEPRWCNYCEDQPIHSEQLICDYCKMSNEGSNLSSYKFYIADDRTHICNTCMHLVGFHRKSCSSNKKSILKPMVKYLLTLLLGVAIGLMLAA